jgi:hypothetical protein
LQPAGCKTLRQQQAGIGMYPQGHPYFEFSHEWAEQRWHGQLAR